MLQKILRFGLQKHRTETKETKENSEWTVQVKGEPYFRIHKDGNNRYLAEKTNSGATFCWLWKGEDLMSFGNATRSIDECQEGCFHYIQMRELELKGIVYVER